MPTDMKMPQLSESLLEATISRWYKQEGEQIAAFEPLLEVETDKVTTDITATASGTVLKIYAQEGETVPVGSTIVAIGQPDEAPAPVQAPSPAPASAPEPAEPADTPPDAAPSVSPVAARIAAELGIDLANIRGSAADGRIVKQDVLEYASAQAGAGAPVAPAVRTDRTDRLSTDDAASIITPVVSRLAAAHNIRLQSLAGSGRGGRITRKDVLAAIESGAAGKEQPAPVGAPPTAATATRPMPTLPGGAGTVDRADLRGDTLEPLSSMRRSIAEHMVRSKQTSPHVTTVMEVDMAAVAAHRETQRAAFEQRGLRLTYTAYMVAATAAALSQHPHVNASWYQGQLRLHRAIHIGVATSLGAAGLIVPVIPHADEKSLPGLARALADLTERARAGQLRPDEVTGGTFTLTNYGTSGSLFGTPIINQPQCAILGVGAIERRVKVLGETLAIRPLAYLSLTFDHRIIDGAAADGFLLTVRQALEAWR